MNASRSPAREPAPPIVQYWHSELIPDEVEAMFESFRRRNPGLEHRVFSESSAERFIAENFGEREVAAFRACAVPAMQADYLRYCAVFTLGGVYCDADLRCVAPVSSLVTSPKTGRLFRLPTGPVTNNFFAFSSPAHPLLRLAIDFATSNIERRIELAVNLVTGPLIFTALDRLMQAGSFDALRDQTEPGLMPLLHSFEASVGSYERVREAFRGVDILPPEKAGAWVADPDTPPAYKETDDHWLNVTTSIFRRP